MATPPTKRAPSTNENKGGLFAPADEALSGCERFSRKLQTSSSYRRLIEEQASDLDAANLDVLRDALRCHLDNAKAAEARYGQRAELSQRTTRFLVTFKKYLDAYGSIVELVSAAGGDYGKAAYGTLSIFLTVAVNKQTRDDKIGGVLEQLCKQYARFKVLEKIHPTPEMKMYIAQAYKLGIEFARYAVFYYLRSSLGRLWSVIVNPPTVFEEALADITVAMEDIRSEGMMLDSKRLHKVDHDLGSVQRTVAEIDARQVKVEREVQDLVRSQWNARLQEFRERILPAHQSVTKAIVDYQVRLDATFDGQRQDIASRLPELRDSEAHRNWSSSQKPSFLVIRGEARHLTHFCWFSPLVLRLFRELQLANEVVAYHCCQVMDSSEPGDRFVTLLNHITFQILQFMPHPLDPTTVRCVLRRLDNPLWGEDSALGLDVLAEILPALKKVTMIIDRVDFLRSDWEDCMSRFCRLASAKVSQNCVVKVILVGSCVTSDWRTLNEQMVGLVREEQVFELNCSESD